MGLNGLNFKSVETIDHVIFSGAQKKLKNYTSLSHQLLLLLFYPPSLGPESASGWVPFGRPYFHLASEDISPLQTHLSSPKLFCCMEDVKFYMVKKPDKKHFTGRPCLETVIRPKYSLGINLI
uniref:Uncharacterized protein n=1 Tax=Anthurium amnicola TaxID=1678845 RepID=A0A1D1XI13_9ARAE